MCGPEGKIGPDGSESGNAFAVQTAGVRTGHHALYTHTHTPVFNVLRPALDYVENNSVPFKL